jgi:hypothetical protein
MQKPYVAEPSVKSSWFAGLELELMTFYGDLTPQPSAEAGGDSGCGKLVPYAWQLLQDPSGNNPAPAAPRHLGPGADNPWIAWWSPLLQLLFYGLGWPQPDLGLANWTSAGSPTDDDALRLVSRWWGERAAHIPAWSTQSPMLRKVGQQNHAAVTDTPYDDADVKDSWARTRKSYEYIQTFGGGGDSMHLSRHCTLPIETEQHNLPHYRLFLPTQTDHTSQVTLIVTNYLGWYRILSSVAPRQTASGRSYNVDVFCTKVGFLGTYRYSRTTGRWFRGQHRWHLIGSARS